MSREAISTTDAPTAIGPYSQAVSVPCGRMVFCSGQIPLDPVTGNIVEGDVVAQAERVMKNLEAVLSAAGVTFSNVVRTTIYLIDLADFARVNEVYARYFPADPPARATVQVSALPRGSKVEIDAIAVA
jgi:2-iminobutanoate/2-iminopropanoate deaminase